MTKSFANTRENTIVSGMMTSEQNVDGGVSNATARISAPTNHAQICAKRLMHLNANGMG